MKTIQPNDKEFVCEIHSPCFNLLTAEECGIIQSGNTGSFQKRDMLTKQGVFANYVLFIIKGLAKQYIEDSSGKNLNLHILGFEEFVGLSSVFSVQTFNYSVQAITECQVMLIEKDTIKNIINKNGIFAMGIISRYCNLNRILFNTLHCVQFRQMNGRLAETLLSLEQIREKHNEIFRLLSRKDIAEFAGISVESTVKILKALESDGILSLKEKDIIIHQKEKLQSIASHG